MKNFLNYTDAIAHFVQMGGQGDSAATIRWRKDEEFWDAASRIWDAVPETPDNNLQEIVRSYLFCQYSSTRWVEGIAFPNDKTPVCRILESRGYPTAAYTFCVQLWQNLATIEGILEDWKDWGLPLGVKNFLPSRFNRADFRNTLNDSDRRNGVES
jgi:hypothetical protein